MLRSLVFVVASSLALIGCGGANDTAEVVVNVNYDSRVDFSQFETFAVLTPELVPDAPEPGDDEEIFNDLVNDLIVEAMTSEPVCMTFIPPETCAP
jgi:hypothetical protein